MANGNISFDPYKTQGNFAGGFNVSSSGFIQGDAQDDPAIRLELCQGTLDQSVANPIWGGIGIMECVASTGSNVSGADIKNPTSTVCNAFAVFNQAYHGITTPNNPVPLFGAGSSVHYYRIGSRARVPLPISAAVAALAVSNADSALSGQGFVWDTTNNVVDVYSSHSSNNPKVAIRLLTVSLLGNLTATKNASGNVVWQNNQPIGLFQI